MKNIMEPAAIIIIVRKANAFMMALLLFVPTMAGLLEI